METRSRYVTMKLARQMQKFFMERDLQCVYENPETKDVFPLSVCIWRSTPVPCYSHASIQVRTMDLNDELGQITHVFSDKTGEQYGTPPAKYVSYCGFRDSDFEQHGSPEAACQWHSIWAGND